MLNLITQLFIQIFTIIVYHTEHESKCYKRNFQTFLKLEFLFIKNITLHLTHCNNMLRNNTDIILNN